MIKEELENRKLERRAKEWLVKDKRGSIVQSLVYLIKEFTEPREKQIQIDAEQIRALQNQNGELTDKVKELEKENADLIARIEHTRCDGIELLDNERKQLTKAKELLKDITSSYGSTEVSEAQLYLKIKKAEQFLKENA